jgi:hypothetical protein
MATYDLTNLQRLCTKAELARAMGVDSRSLTGDRLKPLALLVSAGKTIPVYRWPVDHMLSCVSVNSNLTPTPLSHVR